jgi:acyl transferase domain-containing protein/acyl carrier protein
MNQKNKNSQITGLEIAVIGIAGRFPGASDVQQFWDNLKNGVESISFVSESELKDVGLNPNLYDNPNFVKASALLEKKEYFDSSFFGYTPREAEVMDPQIRLFHQTAWHALEDAGYDPDTYKGMIALYAGATSSFDWQALSKLSGAGETLGGFAKDQLHSRDLLSTRVSHKLNLRGPSFSMFSSCSTSLVALHLASRALLTGECGMALAGGVSITVSLLGGYIYQEGMIFSPDGHCRSFDARGSGTIFGEGVGVCLLKRVKDAIRDGDHIYAMIKASAVNNDGLSKVDFTAPSVKGQVKVIRTALKLARVEAESIGYVETHGTATNLGDPIEITSLIKAYDSQKTGYCAIGAVKSNIGHLEAAAGIAGFIKAVLALKHRIIPPSLHFENPNPEIQFEDTPFYVNTGAREWSANGQPRRAAVSSFGIGGTNAHIILEESPTIVRDKLQPNSRKQKLLIISSKTETALVQAGENLGDFLTLNPDIDLTDAAYTLQVGRRAFRHRQILVTDNNSTAAKIFKTKDYSQLRTGTVSKEENRILFMFSGQGAQYVEMGRGLYQDEPIFRREMDRCFEILKTISDHDFKALLYPRHHDPAFELTDNQKESVNQTEVTQPLLFAFQYSLAMLLMSWGIQPDAMIGHSIGEYTAACLAGVFSIQDALALVVQRGCLMQSMATGAMAGVSMREDELSAFLEFNDDVALAAVNGVDLCVISGPEQSIAAVTARLQESGKEVRPLHTSHAFHSAMMNPMLSDFREVFKEIEIHDPKIPYMSNLTGKVATLDAIKDPRYWADHLRHTVRFADGLRELMKDEHALFIEIGPGKTLTSFVARHENKKNSHIPLNITRHPKEDISDSSFLINKIGQLWIYGQEIDWSAFHGDEKHNRISMPGYPFEGQKYWIDRSSIKLEGIGSNVLARKEDMTDWYYLPIWEQDFLIAKLPLHLPQSLNWLIFIDDHAVGEQLIEILEQHQQKVFVLRQDSCFQVINQREFTINPHQPEDYDRLMEQLDHLDVLPQKIVHLWNICSSDDTGLQLDHFEASQETGLYCLLNLVKAIGNQGIMHDFTIDVVTDNLVEITDEGVRNVQRASLLGAVKVIPLEYFNITCRCIDILLPSQDQAAKHADYLLKEILTEPSDYLVALRGNYRWVQGYKPIPLEAGDESVINVKEKGNYLITGGLGGIGFTLAQFMAVNKQANLILTHRSSFPSRDQWQRWLTEHDNDHPISKKILGILEMEAAGSQVMVVCADVSDIHQMRDALEIVRQELGPIHGIVHAAGEIDYEGIIQRRTPQMTQRTIVAKIKGTLVLDTLCKNDPLDFVVLCSCIGNVLYKDKFAQVGFVASNEFLEYTATYNSKQTDAPFTITINWADWLEVGMVMGALDKMHNSDPVKFNAAVQAISDFALSPSEGVDVFKRIIQSPFHRIIVSPKDLPRMIRQMNTPPPKTSSQDEDAEESHGKFYGRPQLTTLYVEPGNEVEEKLATIFQVVSGIKPVGIYDDFFELGGNSLVAMSAISMIHKQLDIKLPLAELFNRSTVKQLAQYLEEAEKTKYASIVPAKEKKYYALSSAQTRLYVLWEMDSTNIGYNQPQVVALEGDVKKEDVERVFREMIIRHEILRTSFHVVDGVPVQHVHPIAEIDFSIAYLEMAEDLVPLAAGQFIQPFNLNTPPLFRVTLIAVAEKKFVLVKDTHHIICDGVSNEIIIRELLSLYSGHKLEPLRLQYKDFSEWQNSQQQRAVVKKQEQYWLDKFSGTIPGLNMPLDFPRPKVKDFSGDAVTISFEKELSSKMVQLTQASETTMFMLFLSIYSVLLSIYTKQEDIVVGSPITGRPHPDLQIIIGMFVNMLAMRNNVAREKTFLQFLMDVRENSLKAYENQDFQFEQLTKQLGLQGDPSKNPLFSTVLEMMNIDAVMSNIHIDTSPQEESDLKIYPYIYKNSVKSVFDLLLRVSEINSRFHLMMIYSTPLFKRSKIEKLLKHFVEVAEQIVANPELLIKDISISHSLIKVQSTIHQEDDGDFGF